MNLKLPAELHKRATLLRVKRGKPSLQEWLVEAVEAEVERQEREQAEEERRQRRR